MRVYKTIAVVTLKRGFLLLNANQAARRSHILAEANDINIDDLDEDVIAKIGEDLEAFELLGKTQFKVGEVFGYSGDLNKAMAKNMMPAEQVLEEAAAAPDVEEEVDEELVNAILSLETDNSAHFNQNTGKPELAMLKGLMNRNVTGKERDAAWNYILETEPEPEDEDLGEDEAADIDSMQDDGAGLDEENDLI